MNERNIGVGKKKSSLRLMGRITAPVIQKPWGFMQTFRTEKNWWVKTITILPGQRTSLQSHTKRDELWIVVEGEIYGEVGNKAFRAVPFRAIPVKKREVHRISNRGKGNLILVEVACGPAFENDIMRYEDDYGRTKKVTGK